MQTKDIGQYTVTEYEKYSNITRKAKPTDKKGLRDGKGNILVDEVSGNNHFKRACGKAKRWDEADNPTPDKTALNKRLVELNTVANGGRQVHSDDFFLDWKMSDMKSEIARLEKTLKQEGKLLLSVPVAPFCSDSLAIVIAPSSPPSRSPSVCGSPSG